MLPVRTYFQEGTGVHRTGPETFWLFICYGCKTFGNRPAPFRQIDIPFIIYAHIACPFPRIYGLYDVRRKIFIIVCIAVFVQVMQARHPFSSKNKYLIFVNLYAQRIKKARSKACPLQFVQPGIDFIEQPYIPGKSEYGSAPVLKKGNICRTEIPVPGV